MVLGLKRHHFAKKTLDYFAYFFIGVGLLLAVPQLYIIYTTESAEDVSLFSWMGWTVTSVFWIFYGIERKIIPIAISGVLHVALNLIVVIGILEFG